MSVLGGPEQGDWFCLPQTVLCVDRNTPVPASKEHRWIVAGSGTLGPTYQVVLRSTKSWSGDRDHEAHNGRCGSAKCRINCWGRIGGEVEDVLNRELTEERWSCREPCDEVIEWVMTHAYRTWKGRTRGSGGTRRGGRGRRW